MRKVFYSNGNYPFSKFMEQLSYYATGAAFTVVIMTWFVFAAVFLLKRKPQTAPEKTRSNNSIIGIALQGVGFGLVWALRRSPIFSPFFDEQFVLNIVLQILAIALVIFSVWLANSAINELGKQWSLAARLIEEHQLITSGVYQMVRHPIYTAMLGMLLATGITFSHWLILIIAVGVFLIGTKIRTLAEEKLLRAAFPIEYDEFARRTPAFIPFVKFL